MWFQLGVQEALNKAKDEQLLVMVFVYETSESSQQMRDLLEKDEEIQTLLRDQVVALLLLKDNDDYRQFAAIFPILLLPSIFFISFDGVPLEALTGLQDRAAVYAKIEAALQKYKQRLQDATKTESIASSQSTSSSESNESVAAKPPNVRCEDGVCYLVRDDESTSTATQSKSQETGDTPIVSSSSESPTTSAPTYDDKVKKTKELLEELRSKKAAAEAENERKREKERIETGKALQEAKRKREDSEISELIRQREKEMLEAKLAKERVLALIKADQEERKAREKAEQEALAASLSTSTETDPVCQRRSKISSGDKATIQFRLPDGGQFVEIFNKDQSLSDAASAVTLRTGLKSFQLSQTFPKRKFVTEDFDKTFVQLDLVPSAALLVMEGASTSSAISSIGKNSFLSLVYLLWTVPVFIFGFLKGLLFPSGAHPVLPSSDQREAGPPQGNTLGSGASGSSASGSSTSTRTRGAAYASKLLRDNNVTRLNDLPKDDDENNTWNGNSTQQM